MANEFHRTRTADDFLTFFDRGEAYLGAANLGATPVNFTAHVNTGAVQVVLHSHGQAPTFYFVQPQLSVSLPLTVSNAAFTWVKASASDNSCVRIVCAGFSVGAATYAQAAQLITFA